MRVIFMMLLLLLAGCSGGGGTGGGGTSNAPPQIATTAFSVAEGETAVGAISVSDPDGDDLTLSLGGEDGDLFEITGDDTLSFVAAPDFEAPADADLDNIYEIELSVTDGVNTTVGTIAVTVTDVTELPDGLTSLSVTTNPNSTRLLDFETSDGSAYTVMGQRDDAGVTTAIDAISVRNIVSDDAQLNGSNAQVVTDDNGRIARVFFESGGRVIFTYRADGRVSSIDTLVPDGSAQEIVVVKYDDDAPDTAMLVSTASVLQVPSKRSGRLAVISTQADEHCALLGQSGAKPKSKASITTAQVDPYAITEVDTSLSECGNPVSGANVFLVKADNALAPTYQGRDLGTGVYRSSVPVANGLGQSLEDNCLAVIDVVNTTCSAFSDAGGTNPVIVAGLQASCAAFINPAAVAGCVAAVNIGVVYCEYGSALTDFTKEQFCAAARETLDLPTDGMVSYYAVAYLPSGGRAQSAVQSVRYSDPVPDFAIETGDIIGPAILALTDPGDPSPNQGYVIRVAISCRANATSVNVSISGTDDYNDWVTCPLDNGQGGCTLNVPGGAAGVVDTIQIVAGEQSRTLRVTF